MNGIILFSSLYNFMEELEDIEYILYIVLCYIIGRVYSITKLPSISQFYFASTRKTDGER